MASSDPKKKNKLLGMAATSASRTHFTTMVETILRWYVQGKHQKPGLLSLGRPYEPSCPFCSSHKYIYIYIYMYIYICMYLCICIYIEKKWVGSGHPGFEERPMFLRNRLESLALQHVQGQPGVFLPANRRPSDANRGYGRPPKHHSTRTSSSTPRANTPKNQFRVTPSQQSKPHGLDSRKTWGQHAKERSFTPRRLLVEETRNRSDAEVVGYPDSKAESMRPCMNPWYETLVYGFIKGYLWLNCGKSASNGSNTAKGSYMDLYNQPLTDFSKWGGFYYKTWRTYCGWLRHPFRDTVQKPCFC